MRRDLAQLELIKSYKRVFESDDGQKVLHDLIRSHFNPNPFVENDENNRRTNFHLGERNVVAKILRNMKLDHVKILEEINKTIEEEKLND